MISQMVGHSDLKVTENYLDLLGSEMTIEEIMADHPELEKEDILAAINYARLLVSGQTIKIAA